MQINLDFISGQWKADSRKRDTIVSYRVWSQRDYVEVTPQSDWKSEMKQGMEDSQRIGSVAFLKSDALLNVGPNTY